MATGSIEGQDLNADKGGPSDRPTDAPITWAQRVDNLRKSLGRRPTVAELMLIVPLHDLTAEERREQAESWARGMRPTGDPRLD